MLSLVCVPASVVSYFVLVLSNHFSKPFQLTSSGVFVTHSIPIAPIGLVVPDGLWRVHVRFVLYGSPGFDLYWLVGCSFDVTLLVFLNVFLLYGFLYATYCSQLRAR